MLISSPAVLKAAVEWNAVERSIAPQLEELQMRPNEPRTT
jgi:hypothetical protein